MHGDFSRVTFDAGQHYSSVRVQQGRAYLDAEANEQAAILVHSIRSTTRDLIGQHGVPSTAPTVDGFLVEAPPAATAAADGLSIRAGVYYVDGIRCENAAPSTYFAQPDFFPDSRTEPLPTGTARYLVYLDVWERHVTHLDRALLREVALGGPDGASRTQIVWQVKVLEALQKADGTTLADADVTPAEIARIVQGRLAAARPMLRARVKPGDVSTTPCVMPPSGGYRGRENQLYRIEVHEGGDARTATVKWSRDNGSVVFPITAFTANTVTVAHLGLDRTRSIVEGDWVEVLDDVAILHGRHGALARVQAAPDSRLIELANVGGASPTADLSLARHPFLRRWDHRAGAASGAMPIIESADPAKNWIDLEDGIQVQFQPGVPDQRYVTGDYWTIAARTATNAIEWPTDGALPAWLPPTGIEHHYAPLVMMAGATPGRRYRKVVQMTVLDQQ